MFLATMHKKAESLGHSAFINYDRMVVQVIVRVTDEYEFTILCGDFEFSEEDDYYFEQVMNNPSQYIEITNQDVEYWNQ